MKLTCKQVPILQSYDIQRPISLEHFSNACNYHAINGTQLPIAQREDDGSSASIHFILQSNCLKNNCVLSDKQHGERYFIL